MGGFGCFVYTFALFKNDDVIAFYQLYKMNVGKIIWKKKNQ